MTGLIVNTLGGIIGIAIYVLLSKLFGNNANRVITVICVVGTILALIAAEYFLTHIKKLYSKEIKGELIYGARYANAKS